MRYHALALADGSNEVDIVGYEGPAPSTELSGHARIRCHLLRAPWTGRPSTGSALFVLRSALTMFLQAARLFRALACVSKPDLLLLQSPPAVPTLLIGWVAARVRAAKLVVDWHNFGYSMLALKLGGRHPAVLVHQWYERRLGRLADAHLCVSAAMQTELKEAWNIDATLLYDRPVRLSWPAVGKEKTDILRRLGVWPEDRPPGRQPAVLVSSTSWTADEDFNLLLEAVAKCDQVIQVHDEGKPDQPFPPLLILITGHGELRGDFERRMRGLKLRKITIRTFWFSAEDYSALLRAADLGLCLHRSASGVDLPMKIADMFGAGLPVCALDYGPCIREQVRHGENGLLFVDSAELARQIYELFEGFPLDTLLLERLRRNVLARTSESWFDGWKREAEPLFRQLFSA
jgi:beta-1,4-mannosyltransferase